MSDLTMLLKENMKYQAKLVRQQWRRSKRKAELSRIGLSLNGAPLLFAISFPKSGTHLLTQILEGFPLIGTAVDSGLPAVVMYEAATGRERGNDEILRDLSHFSNGDIGYSHLHARPEIVDFFAKNATCPFFILRDPRDVVVSHVHYVTKMEPNHVHHRYYAEILKSFDERLKTSILGRPEAENPFPNIADRFEPFMSWMERPEVLCLKYEDFLINRRETIRKVLEHAVERGFRLSMNEDQAIDRLETMINPQRSPTFRQGKSGGWKNQFSEENKAIFKEVAGDLLIRLGYEQNLDW